MNSRITGDPLAPRKRNPEIPEELEEIILHAMEREPHRRFVSAAAMKEELDNPESVKLTGPSSPFASARRRGKPTGRARAWWCSRCSARCSCLG